MIDLIEKVDKIITITSRLIDFEDKLFLNII